MLRREPLAAARAASRSALASAIWALLFSIVGCQPNLDSTAMMTRAAPAPNTSPGTDWSIFVGLRMANSPNTASE